MPLPEYQLQQVGGDSHNPIFEVRCSIALLSTPLIGIANTRRQAEQNAADAALEALKNVE
jgi:ribonuclease III